MPVDPPRPKSPPLTALRAFEAAGRLGGFARAAEELSVTPGAISQQIRLLEDWAGLQLFRRVAQGVELTDAGDRVLDDVSRAFDALGQAAQGLRAEAGTRVHIAALPAIATLWLAPRLPELRAALPGCEVSVTALETPPNLLRDPFTLSLFYGSADAGVALERDRVFPVCAPALAARLKGVADLTRIACLSDAFWPDDWPAWLRTVAPGQDLLPRGPVFSLYALAVAEAEAGAGVLMGHAALVSEAMQAGRLVRALPGEVTLDRWLVARLPPGHGGRMGQRVLAALRR